MLKRSELTNYRYRGLLHQVEHTACECSPIPLWPPNIIINSAETLPSVNSRSSSHRRNLVCMLNMPSIPAVLHHRVISCSTDDFSVERGWTGDDLYSLSRRDCDRRTVLHIWYEIFSAEITMIESRERLPLGDPG